jgi:serine/threonine-protein kinase
VYPQDYFAAEGDPLLGSLFGGRFRIEGRLGVGAMGTVYRATQASVGRPVALKVLRPELNKDAETAARFYREARATSALKHPNTVTLYDFGETDEGCLYIAMELLEGRLLGQILREEGAQTVERAMHITIEVARSLAEAHRKGIVHRDLKPDNIMLAQVDGQEVVKVLDFGIAKMIGPDAQVDALETQAGTVFGTPRYMSPEQAQSKPFDARSDLYSLGVIFYQMLTGYAPFQDDDAVVVMARHIKTRPRRPSEVRPDLAISGRLERLVMRLLEKDCERRPQSAMALIDELQRCQAAREREFSLIKGAALHARRRALMLALTVVGVVAVFGAVAGVATSVAQDVPPPQAPPPQAAPPALEPVPPARVDLTLDSEPTGAVVLRDGRAIGVTPLVITEIPGTSLELTFERDGYQSRRELVTVSATRSSLLVSLPRRVVDEVPREPPRSGAQRPRRRRKRHRARRRPRATVNQASHDSPGPQSAPTSAVAEPEGQTPARQSQGFRYGRLDDR